MELTNTYTLPNGILTPSGILKKVTLKEMTGEDEERLGALKDANQLYSELFSSLIVTIDGRPMTPELAKNITMGDADFLMVKIRETSFDPSLKMKAVCPVPNCEHEFSVSVNLEDLPVKEQSKLVTGTQTVAGVLPRSGKEVVARLPTVKFQELVAPILKRNPAKATTAFLVLITERLGPSNAPENISDEAFRKMSKVDRDYIGKLVSDAMGGVDTNVELQCPACSHEYETPLDLSNFFDTTKTS